MLIDVSRNDLTLCRSLLQKEIKSIQGEIRATESVYIRRTKQGLIQRCESTLKKIRIRLQIESRNLTTIAGNGKI